MIPLEHREFHQYPRLPRTQEWQGTPVIRGEACACGGWVQQHAGQTVTEAVTDHNQTMQHRAWRGTTTND
jgi:hypothetical protein